MTVQPPEEKIVTRRKIACDGGGVALGHPRIWLHIPDEPGWVECPYCDARYVFAKASEEA